MENMLVHFRRRVTCALALGVVMCFVLRGWTAAVAADDEQPTHGGILRLVRDWRWCEMRDAGPSPSLEKLTPTSRELLDLNAMSPLTEAERIGCDRILWKPFTVPGEWRGQKVWLTYDGRRLELSEICQVWLNGAPVPVALPLKRPGEGICGVSSLTPDASQQPASWFVDIGSRLKFDGPNVLAMRVRRWPLLRSAGVWLYSQPLRERVLFLQSADISPKAQDLVRRYAAHVAKHFPVEPIFESRSFDAPVALREYLAQRVKSHGIGGAVLIGNHPVQRFKFTPEDLGAYSRFYEDLDAVLSDSDGDGFLDRVVAPANFGTEIWTSWIRVVPRRKEMFEPFLQKILDYYEGRLCCPSKPILLPKDFREEEIFEEEQVRGKPQSGLDHFDRFMRPAFLTRVAAHGGVAHIAGPHKGVGPPQAMQFFPGALITHLCGCHGGDIKTAGVTPAEAYYLGRSICVLAHSSTRSEGADTPAHMRGWLEELMNLAPHWGVWHTYLTGFRGLNRSCYLNTGMIMLGNPFVSLRDRFAASSGAIVGRVTVPPGSVIAGFYVSATRDKQWFGRVKTGTDGSYELACLPPGSYEVKLHLNAFEALSREVTAEAGKTTVVNWPLPVLWEVRGQVLDAQGKPDRAGWAEAATKNNANEFTANDLFGLRTDEQGCFAIHGANAATFWLRGRSGRQFESPALQVSVQPGQRIEGQQLRVGIAAQTKRARSKKGDMDYFTCAPEVQLEVPSGDGLPPIVNVVGLYAGLVPAGDKTLLRAGAPPRNHQRLGRAKHTLRLAFELTEPLPQRPPQGPLRYVLEILTSPERQAPAARHRRKDVDYSVRLHYIQNAARWKAEPNELGLRPNYTFWISPPQVAGEWLVLDLNPFSTSKAVDWRIALTAFIRPEDEGRQSKRVPAEGWFRLRAELGESPSLSLESQRE